ncbi:MAG: TraX family protein [Cyanobacteria bacterium P01_D01_bin.105]
MITAFDIKLIAAVTMLIDHIGAVFFPEQLIFRVIGRISFPLFAWLAAQGQAHTRNLSYYLIRLLALGLLTQPIYNRILQLVEPTYTFQLNILFTLALGIVFTSVLQAIRSRWFKAGLWLLGWMLDIVLIPIEGGFWSVATVWLMSKLRPENRLRNRLLWYGGYALFVSMPIFSYGALWVEIPTVLCPLITFRYGGKQGHKARWFYAFYPLHFAALIAIKQMG